MDTKRSRLPAWSLAPVVVVATLTSVSGAGEASATPGPCSAGYQGVPLDASPDMEWPASTLRLCRSLLSDHSLQLINEGPFVVTVSGAPPEQQDAPGDVLPPKAALFRQATRPQDRLTVAPGQRDYFTSDRVAPDLGLDYALQAQWEMLSYTVDLVETKGDMFIDRAGPNARAVIQCSQAAYGVASAVDSDPNGASAVSFEDIIETAGDAKDCKSAIDTAKEEAAKLKRPPVIIEEDFRGTSLESNSFQRAAKNFMEALRRFGKIVKLK